LLALADPNEITEALQPLVEFRFDPDSSLKGHSLGNLLMAALTSVHSGVQEAVDEMARILRIRGQVLPVTLDRANLCAELEDGEVLCGESNIDLRGVKQPRISRVFLDREVQANPRAIQAVLDADAVVMGPGDLYTSIIPNLLATGVAQAIAETKATRIYVCNLMTKLGETDDFTANDFVREMVRYLGGPFIDAVIVSSQAVPEDVQERYAQEGAEPVSFDSTPHDNGIRWLLCDDVAQLSSERKVRHSAEGLARAISAINRYRNDLQVSVKPLETVATTPASI
jgi:uncharacterized cofD-like protein